LTDGLLLRSSPTPRPGFHSRYTRLTAARHFDLAKERREVARDIDTALLSHNLYALYFAFMIRWLRSGEPSPDRRQPPLRQMLELHLRSVAA